MELEYAFLAKAVEQNDDETLNIYGLGVVRTGAFAYPTNLNLILVVGLHFRAAELGSQHQARFTLQPNGGDMIGDSGNRSFTAPPLQGNQGRDVVQRLNWTPGAIPLPHPGSYTYRIIIDGKTLKTIKWYAELITPS